MRSCCSILLFIFVLMKNKLIIFAILVAVALPGILYLAFAQDSGEQDDETLKIAASIFPVYDIAQNIVGDNAEIVQVLPSGSSPHTYEPDAAKQSELNNIDALFMIGNELDEFAEDSVSASNDRYKKVVVDKNIDLMESDHSHSHDEEHDDEEQKDNGSHEEEKDHNEEGDEHGEEHEKHEEDDHNEDEASEDADGHEEEHKEEHEDEHKHGEYDPHYWLSVDNAKEIAETIYTEVSEIDPSNESEYKQNYETYISELDELKTELDEILDVDEMNSERKIITFHNAFGYFAEEYNIEIVATIEEFAGQEPSPEYINGVVAEIEEYNIETLFKEPQLPDTIVDALSNDYNVDVLTIDPLGGAEGRNSYIELMRYNAEQISQAL